MAESKKIQNAKRLRYIRALERFSKSVVGYLSKSDTVTKEGFYKKRENAKKVLDRAEKVPLYKGEYRDLETFVEKIFLYDDESIEQIQKEILYSANQLEKSRNFKKYKKPKYSNNLEEW